MWYEEKPEYGKTIKKQICVYEHARMCVNIYCKISNILVFLS